MNQAIDAAGWALLLLALAGSAYAVLAGLRVRAWRSAPAPQSAIAPAATLLKPLHGDEPGLDRALQSFANQDYSGRVQIIFGVQDPEDDALPVVEQLRQSHPDRDFSLIVDTRPHGANQKISNLINMATQIRHEIVVLSDSDIAVAPDYLRRVLAALDEPGVGVATCPYYGKAEAGFWSRLAAMGISYHFLPSVAVGVWLDLAHPCMGSTIALRQETLRRIGGFEAFADVLADDYAIGGAVRAAGYRSVTAPVLVAHGCAERSFGELVAHELRWARTIRGVDPAGFLGSGVTHALPLALAAAILLKGHAAALAVLCLAAVCRLWLMRQVDKAAGSPREAWWLMPVRDILSFVVFVASFLGRKVEWRGARFRVGQHGELFRI